MTSSSPRGFTLVEVLFTLALVALVATTGTYTYRTLFSKGNDRAGTVTLSGVQAQARGVAARSSYAFPLDLRSQISSFPGATNPLVDGAVASSVDSGRISLGVYEQAPARPGEYTVAVLALATSSLSTGEVRCVVVIDDLAGETLWIRDDAMTPERCRADVLADPASPMTPSGQRALRSSVLAEIRTAITAERASAPSTGTAASPLVYAVPPV